jgi:phospholipid/cholesterol/gamma-HCH transport system substrate-binding protein
MEPKREQAFVGLFVVIAAGLLIFTVFGIAGAMQGPTKTYYAKFSNAAGLEPGTTVRFEGGPKVGRVEKLEIDKTDPSKIDITFSVKNDLPVKTDSLMKIESLSPLGDNHLEMRAGSPSAPVAPSGTLLPSKPYVGLNDITAQLNDLAPQAKELIVNLNERVVQLKQTIDRVDDLLNDRNRANISGSLAQLHGMLQEDRPILKQTLGNVNRASAKMEPLLDQLRKTTEQANATINHVDGLIGENREDIRAAVQKLRQSLATISSLTARLDQTLDVNSENIDEMLDNMRHVSENLKEFSNTIKTHPSTLVRSSNPREHRPGDKR